MAPPQHPESVVVMVLQRIGWAMVAVGILLAALFVSGLTHPVSAQVPSTLASYNSHKKWVIVGFSVSMVGAALLLVTETFRRNTRTLESKPTTVRVD